MTKHIFYQTRNAEAADLDSPLQTLLPTLLPTLLLTLLLTGFTSASAQVPLRVVTTVGMLADVAAEVGGSCVEVSPLMGPGVDPHLYQASASDVRAMQQADVVLYTGYLLEGQLGEVLARFGRQKPVVAVAEAAIAAEELLSGPYEGSPDPHVWMDVALWTRTSDVIADTIAELRPDCAEEARSGADAYRAQLAALDDWVATAIATIPERQRILVTAHDAFAYYGRAYGIDVAGIQGISTEAEAGIADIRNTIDLVIERRVPAVFVESTINPRTVTAVIEAAADRGHEVAVGGQLFSDAMGEPGTADGTYIGMIVANTRAITSALGGAAPPLPEELDGWRDRWGIDPL